MNSVLPLRSSSNCGGMRPYVVANQSRLHRIFQAEIPESDSPTHSGYGLGLRLLIQEHKKSKTSQQEPELETDPPNFRELLSENLTQELDEIISFIDQEAQSRSQGKKQALTLDDTVITARIDAWTDKLITELKHDIQRQVYFFFSSLLDQKNSENFVKEVQEFFKTNPRASQKRRNLIQDLSARYPIEPIQAKHLVDILEPDRLSLKQIKNTLLYIAKENRLLEKKGQMIGTFSKFASAALGESLPGLLRQSAIGSLAGAILMRIQKNLKNYATISQIDLSEAVETTLNGRIADALLMTEYNGIDESKFAEIHTRLTKGKDASYDLMSYLFSNLTHGVKGVFAMIGLFYFHPILGLINFSTIPLNIYKYMKFKPEFQDLHREQSQAETENAQKVLDCLESIDDARLSTDPMSVSRKLNSDLDQLTKTKSRGAKLKQRISLIFDKTFWNTMILSSGVSVGLWYEGALSEFQVIASSAIAELLHHSFFNMVGTSNNILQKLLEIQDMELLLQSAEKISLEQDAKKPGVDSLENHDLTINNLGFTGQDGTEIIKGINLNIPQGSFMTITGESGGGKSTLLRCLLGLYKPSSGSITIGGKPRDELKQNGDNSVKALISSCRQAPTYLPHLSLRDNLLLYSSVPAEDTRIKEVLTQLGLEKFTGKLDEKLAKPSGGEKVRIGLARALLRNNGENKILVLDEATTGVDAKTEKEIIDCLKELQKSKPDLTIIWVTHSKQVVDEVNNNYHLEIRSLDAKSA